MFRHWQAEVKCIEGDHHRPLWLFEPGRVICATVGETFFRCHGVCSGLTPELSDSRRGDGGAQGAHPNCRPASNGEAGRLFAPVTLLGFIHQLQNFHQGLVVAFRSAAVLLKIESIKTFMFSCSAWACPTPISR